MGVIGGSHGEVVDGDGHRLVADEGLLVGEHALEDGAEAVGVEGQALVLREGQREIGGQDVGADADGPVGVQDAEEAGGAMQHPADQAQDLLVDLAVRRGQEGLGDLLADLQRQFGLLARGDVAVVPVMRVGRPWASRSITRPRSRTHT